MGRMIVARILGWVLLGFMVLFTLVPFLMIALTSFKSMPEINDVAQRDLFRRILPDRLTNLSSYSLVISGESKQLNGTSFLVYIKNSIIVAVLSVTPALFFTVSAAYGFAKYSFPFKNVMLYMLLGLLIVPMEMVSIPLYLIITRLRLANTYVGIAIPFAISAFGLFVVKDSIEPIPSDYIEAARIDGASEFWILTRIIVPMVKTAIVTFLIIKFLWTWNEYFWPLLVVNTDRMKTVTLGLSRFSTGYFQEYSELSAAVMLSLMPILVMYIFTRRFIVKGVVLSGLKS